MLTRSLFPAGSLAPAAVVQRQQEIVAALDLNKCQASAKMDEGAESIIEGGRQSQRADRRVTTKVNV
jgi:hypothetical protein